MTAIGGSIDSVTIAGRTFSVTGDADTGRKLGGYENETQPNGDGTARQIKSRVAWSVTGLVVSCNDANGDQEFLQDLSDRNGNEPITVAYASGDVYQGEGTVNGELAFSNQSATAALDLGGPGKLTKQ